MEEFRPDYVLLNGNIHYETDIQDFLQRYRQSVDGQRPGSSSPITAISGDLSYASATALGLRSETPEENWIAPEDLRNLLLLAGYEQVREEGKLLIPLYIPVLAIWPTASWRPCPDFASLICSTSPSHG